MMFSKMAPSAGACAIGIATNKKIESFFFADPHKSEPRALILLSLTAKQKTVCHLSRTSAIIIPVLHMDLVLRTLAPS